MADIYLTKKERTTLYTEGFIYSIVIVIASYFTIYGSLFINMIPILFILGIIGRCIFDKPKTTVFLGTLAILLIGITIEFKIDLNLVLTAVYSAIMIFLGLVVGKYIRMLYYSYKLRIFMGYNKKIIIIVYIILILFLVVFLNSIINSNPIQYIIAKNRTDKYINKTYGVKEYNLNDISYGMKTRGGYTFNVNVLGENITLVHKTSKIIEDTGLEERKDQISKIQNEKLIAWKNKNNIGKELAIYFIYSYSKVAIVPDILEINIETATSGKGIEYKAKEILDIISLIEKLKTFDGYSKISGVNITIDNISMSIKKDNFNKELTKEYIQKGLNIEYLD